MKFWRNQVNKYYKTLGGGGVIEQSLMKEINISKNQFRFMSSRSTVGTLYLLRHLTKSHQKSSMKFFREDGCSDYLYTGY